MDLPEPPKLARGEDIADNVELSAASERTVDEGDAAERSVDAVAIQPRLSYHTGYGDFCFSRLSDIYNYMYETRPEAVHPNRRENNVLFIEKDGFQRSVRGV